MPVDKFISMHSLPSRLFTNFTYASLRLWRLSHWDKWTEMNWWNVTTKNELDSIAQYGREAQCSAAKHVNFPIVFNLIQQTIVVWVNSILSIDTSSIPKRLMPIELPICAGSIRSAVGVFVIIHLNCSSCLALGKLLYWADVHPICGVSLLMHVPSSMTRWTPADVQFVSHNKGWHQTKNDIAELSIALQAVRA